MWDSVHTHLHTSSASLSLPGDSVRFAQIRSAGSLFWGVSECLQDGGNEIGPVSDSCTYLLKPRLRQYMYF